ncbi:Ran binding protein 9 [Fasciola hepatica]|uniref:Ran binding protein 9 n=1 Tax=Fasciola hepatica TaxID=6192 RepID=A0A4E0RPU5_FASHE|nr:Ran binding protein 9 [Fasciola hepatica]
MVLSQMSMRQFPKQNQIDQMFTMQLVLSITFVCPPVVLSLYQHVHCMESFYHTTLPNLAIGYICIECNTDVVATIPGVPRFAAPVEAVITATAASDENLTACGSGNFTALPTVDESMASVESESGLSVDGGHEEATKRLAINQGTVGAQYVEAAADRAKRLGLIPSSISKVSDTRDSGWLSEKHGTSRSKELDVGPRPGWNAVDWEKLNEISRSARRTAGDTNVNLRMPSPPRASKRKQDLTSTSYNDNDVQVSDPEKKSCTTAGSGATVGSTDDFSSNNTTPISTPSLTPFKGHPSGTPTSTPGRTLTPCSEFSSSPGLDSPVHTRSRGEKRRHKPSRVLFPDSSNPNKRGFGAHANPLGAAWAKDYQEAENNAYTKALLDHVEERISANLERNYRIPPSCLTRSSLCRVVLFDHDDKGLEASIRLSPTEVVTEVRGQFLLLEEYEHYVDPVSEYNRYVLFYNGFGERGVVIDATQYGNSARFIRRSCIPNCRLEHYVVQGKLLVVVRTSTEVTSGTELTIPFDLDYQACRYPLDCACARSRCPVLKWRRKLLRNKVVPNLDYSKYIESQLRVLSKPLSQESPNSRVDSCLSGSPLMKASLGTSSLPGSPSSFSMPFSMNRVNPALGSLSPLSGSPIMLSSSARSVRPGTSYEGLDDRVARSARYHPSPDSVTTGAHSPLHENIFKSLGTSNPSVSAPSTVTDENERPDEAMLSGSASSEPETAQSDNKINPESPCHNSGPHTVGTTKLVCFLRLFDSLVFWTFASLSFRISVLLYKL